MAIVECGLCGWVEEFEEEQDEEQWIPFAKKAYAEHMWKKHPHEARTDWVAIEYIRARAAHQARTS